MKRELTLPGKLKDIGDYISDTIPEEPIPPLPAGAWCQEVYILTKDFGVFHTTDFVTVPEYIDGVPTWTAINTGLTLVGTDGLGFRGDPWEPDNRQYCLMTDGLYRRVAAGNWVSILTRVAAMALCGGDSLANSYFGHNGLDTSINQEGHVAVVFVAGHTSLGWRNHYIVSGDYGATWTALPITGWIATGCEVGSLTMGAYQGNSIHGPGQAIYCGGELGIATHLYYSTDGGQNWGSISLGGGAWWPHILVDPNDQSRVFVGCRDGVGPWNVYVSLDHGATISQYDGNALEDLGFASPYYHLSVGMDPRRTVRVGAASGRQHMHMTRDDGVSWDEPTPQFSADSLAVSLVQDAVDKLYLMRLANAGAPEAWHTIWASENEARIMVPKAGANCAIAGTGGGDSIPFDCGGLRGILQVWTNPDRHGLGSTEHTGPLTYPQVSPLVGTGPSTVAAGSHGPQHENGGADEISVAGLSGDLADEQDPKDHDHQGVGSDGGKLTGPIVDTYEDFEEISTPANPPGDVARVYSKDDGGVTKLYYKRPDGTEVELGVAAGALPVHDHKGVGADGGKLTGAIIDSFLDFEEIAAPANPGADVARVYSRDDAGTTKFYYRRSDGTEVEIGGGAGGAPVDASYVTEELEAGLTDERVLGTKVITTTTEALKQAAAIAGRLFLPSNGFVIHRDTGAAWVPWGPLFPLTKPPALAAFAWINQGGATATEVNGGIHLAGAAAGNLQILKKSAPGTPYSIVAAVLPLCIPADASGGGLCWRQSSDGKLVTAGVARTGAANYNPAFVVQKWTDPDTWSATYVALTVYNFPPFMKITDDGANRICYFGLDGINWYQAHSVGRTDFLTADEVGFYVLQNGRMSFISWQQI